MSAQSCSRTALASAPSSPARSRSRQYSRRDARARTAALPLEHEDLARSEARATRRRTPPRRRMGAGGPPSLRWRFDSARCASIAFMKMVDGSSADLPARSRVGPLTLLRGSSGRSDGLGRRRRRRRRRAARAARSPPHRRCQQQDLRGRHGPSCRCPCRVATARRVAAVAA